MTSVSGKTDLENVYVADTSEPDKNGNIQKQLLTTVPEVGPQKRKRLPYRPYASPTNRIISKCGRYNVLRFNIPEKKSRYIKDLGNTLLTIRWRWILLSLCVSNIVAYFIFTVLWILMVMWEESYMNEPDKTPCIKGGNSSTRYFTLAVKTITSIGGDIYPIDCHSGWVMLTLQAITAIVLEGVLVTAVYVKMSSPHEKQCARMFSKKAVICRRDGVNCLIFRIRDICGKYLAKTTIKVILIQGKYTGGAEAFLYYCHKLLLDEVGLLIWPQEIVHRITEDSPLWTMSRFDIYKARFELMIVLEGDSLSTGKHSQCQTSYTNKEILWGYCFSPCVEYDGIAQKYIINKKMFNDVLQQELSECSAQELQSVLSDNGIDETER